MASGISLEDIRNETADLVSIALQVLLKNDRINIVSCCCVTGEDPR